jgi:hypothetical protein
MKFAVVQWIDDKYYLETSFFKGFDSFEEAKQEAYRLAEEKSNDQNTRIGHGKPGYFLKTNVDLNKINVSPYIQKTIIEYGAEFGNTTYFYSVVEWFDGVTEKIKEFYDVVEEDDECYCSSQKYTLCSPCQLKFNDCEEPEICECCDECECY